MGMAIIEEKVPRKPRYKNTVVCTNCDAEYQPGNWVYGTYKNCGTATSEFQRMGKIPKNSCPICRTERE